MEITELIDPERIARVPEASSKKRVIEMLSERLVIGQTELSARAVFDSLIGRERLGSTGLGHGVALPHGRVTHTEQAIGAFLKLDKGVDFDALDRQPVDLIFGLLVPDHYTDEHLRILSHLAEMFSDPAFCQRLRQADHDQALYQFFHDWRSAAPPVP